MLSSHAGAWLFCEENVPKGRFQIFHTLLRIHLILTDNNIIKYLNLSLFAKYNSKQGRLYIEWELKRRQWSSERHLANLINLTSLGKGWTNVHPDFQNGSKKLFHIDSEWLKFDILKEIFGNLGDQILSTWSGIYSYLGNFIPRVRNF